MSRSVRVASVPRSHVYVRHLDAVGGGSVRRLPDPTPRGAGTPGRWWPPVMLGPGWVDAHHDAFDVMHVHFGFDALAPEALAEVCASLRDHGRALVYTVHDLVNPHHHDPGAHANHLDVLIGSADALVTLTPGAAAEVRRRWGREAEVLPHPHVVPLDLLDRPRRPRGPVRVVGVHAKSLRANLDPVGAARALLPLLDDRPDLRLRLDVHLDVLDGAARAHERATVAALRELAGHPRVDLVAHDYFTDDELWDYLGGLDVSVLPYRFGTHSGWLEACHDLGTAVVAPSCGSYADQRPVHTYDGDVTGLDPEGLRAAVTAALATAPDRPGRAARTAERARLDAAHLDVYRRALAAPGKQPVLSGTDHR